MSALQMVEAPPTRASEQGTEIVWLTGELDLLSAPSLRRSLTYILATADLAAGIVIDLSGVTFIDLAGLEPLLELQARISACAGGLALRGAPPCVTKAIAREGHAHRFATGLSPAGDRSSPAAASTHQAIVTHQPFRI